MKLASLALCLCLCGQPLLAQAPQPGQFVKPAVSLNFKEALTISDISLMLRTGLSEAEITQEISQRGLVAGMTDSEAQSLQEKGASSTLLARLRDPLLILTPEEFQKYQERQVRKQSGGTEASIPSSEPKTMSLPAAPVAKEVHEIEIPVDQFTRITLNGTPLSIAIHDIGDSSINVRVGNHLPKRFLKAEGLDAQHNNLTLIYENEVAKIYYVNTPRAHMNMCFLRLEGK